MRILVDVKGLFIELPAFMRHRADYLDDDSFRALQQALLADPLMGDIIPGAGGLRKMRFGDARRGKGRRGGLRIVYFWWETGRPFWLFTLFDKNEMGDMSSAERESVKRMIKGELRERSRT
jgi:hypothetical protein